MIVFDQVSKKHPNGFEALKAISFKIEAGEMAFVTGHSGAGKSTLLRLLAMMEKCTRGKIEFDGQDLNAIKSRGIPALRRKLGMVFQDHRLLSDRNVFENVAMPLLIAGISKADIGKRVRAALDQVGMLPNENALPVTLSGGEQQRVGIARAIVSKPTLIIADEPTGNLDPQLASEIMSVFASLQSVGTTILVASHDLHLIRRLQKRVLVLDHGKLIDDFRPSLSSPTL